MKTILIENKSGKVKLNEVVTRESIGKMIDEIGKLFGATASASGADFGEIMNAAENAVDVLEIEINSPGGSVFDGYTVYHEIQSLKDRGVVVNATITGMAASMASVICMACDKVSIVPHGRMMIHDASSGFSGNAEQMRKQADLLDGISADIANIYSARTGKEVAEIRAMMKKETWMDSKTTVENGFADEVVSKANALVEITLNTDTQNSNSETDMIFLTNKAAVEKISGLEARTAELEAEISAHAAEVEALKAEQVTASEAIAERDEKIVALSAELSEKVSAISAELAEKAEAIAAAELVIQDQEAIIETANEKLASFDEEVASKAQLQIASLGFTGSIPEASSEVGATLSTREQINAIPDAKKRQEARLKNWKNL
jgi:ATP-dependent Clp endopeptidase proteolytic subunit ClpP